MRAEYALQEVRVNNFKAIQDSGRIRLTRLTVFIGNTGSGKSSIIEALKTVRTSVEHGLDGAVRRWRGVELGATTSALRHWTSAMRPLWN
jgi:AAA15 family ATPase/GTPase